jgi:hypothetical protein
MTTLKQADIISLYFFPPYYTMNEMAKILHTTTSSLRTYMVENNMEPLTNAEQGKRHSITSKLNHFSKSAQPHAKKHYTIWKQHQREFWKEVRNKRNIHE